MKQYDFIILGSGSAGLTFALRVCEAGRVALITKKESADSNTNWAQGGIAAVVSPDDDVNLHFEDTLIAGAGLCDKEAVRALVTEGPERIKDLIDAGAQFSRGPNGELSLGREGGHSRRRIIHTADLTGREVERTLVNAVRDHPGIDVLEHHFAIDFVTKDNRCLGAYILDALTGRVERYIAPITLLATGGLGQIYRYTTNPTIATGDGVGMAWRAGVEIRDMEFIQFHPTSLFHPDAKSFLISEAVRGEGAILRRKNGLAFMEEYDPERKDLAPRDIVARAIDAEIKKSGDDCVYLDLTHLPPNEIRSHFPSINSRCLSYGIDITTDWIPVVPAAHYSCGGVLTDLMGRASLDGLYACGEVASTGIHGGNRLASNSLLEAMVFGTRAAGDALSSYNRLRESMPEPSGYDDLPQEMSYPPIWAGYADPSVVESMKRRIQTVMHKYVGIVRSNVRLQNAAEGLKAIRADADPVLRGHKISDTLMELRNMLDVAELIVQSAMMRRESRGLHYNVDYPNPSGDELHNTIVKK
jgi:L-aspartate oxidase